MVFYYFILSGSISFLLLFVSYYLNYYYINNDIDKLVGYECGFDPFNDARDTFHIKFYLISILFIIFDIEIIFFFPWVLNLNLLLLTSFYTMTLFLIFLVIGFWYEWKKCVIDFD